MTRAMMPMLPMLLASVFSAAEGRSCFGNDVFIKGKGNAAFKRASIPADCTSLDLGDSNIGDRGATALADVLRYNTVLESLDLGYNNKIGDLGAASLAAALKLNTALKTLILSENLIGDEGATALALALLNKNTALSELDLSSNKIGTAGAYAIAKTLEENTSLRTLDLSSNKIGNDGGTVIANALREHNNVLTSLPISGNKIKLPVIRSAIQTEVNKNKKLANSKAGGSGGRNSNEL